MYENSIEDLQEEEIISQEDDKKQKKSNGKVIRKTIKKTKWKYIIQVPLKQTHVFYLYGNFIVFTELNPDHMYDINTVEVISNHQQTQCVTLNKVLNTIETRYNIIKPGMTDFSFLVKLFENKQDQNFYDFAQSLKDFKIHVDTTIKNINENKKLLKNQPKILDKLDEQYFEFEKWCQEIEEKYFKDEFFNYSVFQINYRRGFAEMKKNVNSQNMINLYGNTLDEMLESEMCRMKNKQFNMDGSQDFDAAQFLELMSQTISCTTNQKAFSSTKFNFRTLEGFQVPAIQENHFIKYSDYKKNDKDFISISDNDYFMFVCVTKIEDRWLKKLLDVRQELASFKQLNNPITFSEDVPQDIYLNNSIHLMNETESSHSVHKTDNFHSIQNTVSTNSIQTEPKYFNQEDNNNSSSLSQSIQQYDSQLKCSQDQSEIEFCFIPQTIDLVGCESTDTISKNDENQNQKNQIVAECIEKYYSQRQQSIDLSTLEYQCQVEYFIDRFYKKQDDEVQKQCQFRDV